MTFHSILFERTEDSLAIKEKETVEAPVFFSDLNLDQIVDTITASKQEYNLKPFFYFPLNDINSILYRYEIMWDLENNTLLEYIKLFAEKMRSMREHLAQADKRYYKYQQEGWFLDAVEIYCEAVNDLVNALTQVDLKSRGLLAFREYMAQYSQSARFTSLQAETKKLKIDLSTVKYCLLIKGNSIKVRKYEGEIDYSAEVEKTFEKFKQGAVKDYTFKFPNPRDMDHVEAEILEFVAQLYPEIFSSLNNFFVKNAGFLDETTSIFDREIQFFIAYLEYVAIFHRAGLKFCYAQVSDKNKEVYGYEEFDLALAYKLLNGKSPVVYNDFYLKNPERIFVVTGPNQGGKTTFARTFGQLHYLVRLGCPVPGREAQLFVCDKLFTHFEREENLLDFSGKLQDDLVRINYILNHSTSNSIIIMNEIFTSTTLQDAIFLSNKVMGKIIQLDLLCVCVTFMDELASLSEKTVSMVSTTTSDNASLRTYKVVRRPADGLAYALSIAEKYRLTYDCLKERIKA